MRCARRPSVVGSSCGRVWRASHVRHDVSRLSRVVPLLEIIFLDTALPRVGVVRPNGSYVARTVYQCWLRDLPSFVDERDRMYRRTYRASTPSVSSGGKTRARSSRLLVNRSENFRPCLNASATRSSTSEHRAVDLASGRGGYTPLLWENENEQI